MRRNFPRTVQAASALFLVMLLSCPLLGQHNASCRIHAPEARAGGSGVLIGKGHGFALVLTCDHVTEGTRRGGLVICHFPALAKFGMATAVRGSLVASNPRIDGSLIAINENAVKPLTPAKMHTGPVYRGTPVITDGFPTDDRIGKQVYVQIKGTVTSTSNMSSVPGGLHTTIQARSGHSGGPIYHGESWGLMGIVSGGIGLGNGWQSWGLRTGHLYEWLRTVRFSSDGRPFGITYTQGGCQPYPMGPGQGQPPSGGGGQGPIYTDPSWGGGQQPPGQGQPQQPQQPQQPTTPPDT